VLQFFRKSESNTNNTRSLENLKESLAETGIDVITTPVTIRHLLQRLQKGGDFISLFFRSYESVPTIIVDCVAERLLIATPPDWPAAARPGVQVKAVFHDDKRLWNHFKTKLLAVGDDTLVLEFPSAINRMQRRNHFRVLAPAGSRTNFYHGDLLHQDIMIRDISAGGMLVSVERKLPLEIGVEVSKINLMLASFENKKLLGRLLIGRGRIVRISFTDRGRYCYSFAFSATGVEKSELLIYVRRLELEYLRYSLAR